MGRGSGCVWLILGLLLVSLVIVLWAITRTIASS